MIFVIKFLKIITPLSHYMTIRTEELSNHIVKLLSDMFTYILIFTFLSINQIINKDIQK